MDFLTRLRLKSPLVRAQYALGTASVVTGVITLIRLSALPARFADFGEFEFETVTTSTPTLRTAPSESTPREEGPAYQGVTEGLGSLGEVQHGSTSTPTTTQGVKSTASTSRAIQIATTSQNHN